jgi:hypothetical protein
VATVRASLGTVSYSQGGGVPQRDFGAGSLPKGLLILGHVIDDETRHASVAAMNNVTAFPLEGRNIKNSPGGNTLPSIPLS